MKRKSFLQIILCLLTVLAIACSPLLACTPTQKTFTGVELKDVTVAYTGDKYSLEVEGLPDGATVTYTYNGEDVDGVRAQGEYEVVAVITKDGYKTKTLTATLTITEPHDMNVTLGSKEVTYDGQIHSLEVVGAPDGAIITYTYNGVSANGVSEVGLYDVMAVVTKKGYKPATLTATLLIADQDEIIGVSLEDDRILYDGQKHSLTIQGLPSDAGVTYTYNGINVDGVTDEGEYEVVAVITKEGYKSRTLSATLIIYKPKFTFTTSTVNNSTIPTINTSYPALVNVPLEADVFSTKDLEASHTPISPVTVTLTASGAVSSGATAKVDSSGVITISAPGSYYIKGNSKIVSSAQIVVNESAKLENVFIILQNARLSNNGKAPLYVKSAKKVFLYLEGENELVSTGTFPETDEDGVDAAIFTRDNLTIKGSGSLTVTSVKKGIVAKDNLRVTGGTLTVNATARAIDANDCFSITNANVTLNSQNNDGATVENLEDATKGYFFMNSGSLNIIAKKDGIQTSGAFEVLGGTINIVSGGGNTVVSDPLLTSAKGIKATGDMLINGGNITIDASEDAIHGSSAVHISGGVLNLSSNKDAIDVDKAIVVDGATITSQICADGLKGESVTVKSGTVSVKALQDGLKATEETGDTSTDTTPTTAGNDHKCFINITGGNVNVDVEDNALDSKGNIAITGGNVAIVGSSLGLKALNYNGLAFVTNGKVTAVALKEKAVNFSSATGKSVLISLDNVVSAGTKISIKKDGVTAFETTLTKDVSSILMANVLTAGEYEFIIGENTETLII